MSGREASADAGRTDDSINTAVITKKCYRWQWFLRCFLIIFYVIDFGLNIYTVVNFFNGNDVLRGSLSVGICLGSGTVVTIISALIAGDSNRDHESGSGETWSEIRSLVLYNRFGGFTVFVEELKVFVEELKVFLRELLRWLKFCVFQLTVPQRHLQTLAFTCKAYQLQASKYKNNNKIKIKNSRAPGIKGKRSKKNAARAASYHRRMLREHRNIASIDLVNCCFKTAPQFILEMSLQLNHQDETITVFVLIRILGWIWNIIMLGWTMRSIHTTSRSTDPDRLELSKIPSLLVFVGHTGTMGARLILISVGASMWPQETLVACLLIGIAWFVWLHQTADARQFLYKLVNLFLNVVSLYLIHSYTTTSESFTLKLVCIIVTLDVIGNVALIIYYTCCHPTKQHTKKLDELRKIYGSEYPVVENDAAVESVSSQDTNKNNYASLDVPKFGKLPLRFDRVFNKVLDLIGELPTHSPLNEVRIHSSTESD